MLKFPMPGVYWKWRRALQRYAARLARAVAERFGVVMARKSDYYSPLPSEGELHRTRSRWAKPSALLGVAFDLEMMKSRLSALSGAYSSEFGALEPFESMRKAGYGPGYTHVDAFTLYAMIRKLQPRTYLEIGSGLSTCYCHLARKRNRENGRDTRMVCIEPHPYPKLSEIEQIELIRSEVQDVPLTTFASLCSGDVLFIDS